MYKLTKEIISPEIFCKVSAHLWTSKSCVSAIAMSGVEDIRTVLDHYNQFDDPLEAFKENQRLLQVQHSRSVAKHYCANTGIL